MCTGVTAVDWLESGKCVLFSQEFNGDSIGQDREESPFRSDLRQVCNYLQFSFFNLSQGLRLKLRFARANGLWSCTYSIGFGVCCEEACHSTTLSCPFSSSLVGIGELDQLRVCQRCFSSTSGAMWEPAHPQHSIVSG
jgi:hypothetical protein